MGHLNTYAMEDPIAATEGGGDTDLVASRIGTGAYSYGYFGQAGYLDHALANSMRLRQPRSLCPSLATRTWNAARSCALSARRGKRGRSGVAFEPALRAKGPFSSRVASLPRDSARPSHFVGEQFDPPHSRLRVQRVPGGRGSS
jgi:hypothetical protein